MLPHASSAVHVLVIIYSAAEQPVPGPPASEEVIETTAPQASVAVATPVPGAVYKNISEIVVAERSISSDPW